MKKNKRVTIPDEIILNKIILVRGIKVMIDRDLAALYKVSTKRLNEQVKRNKKRFPEDFMFQLTLEEKEEVIAFCDHLQPLKYSSSLPYAFTEHGAVMLAGVLNSDRAIKVNILIVRIFNKIREVLLNSKDLLFKIEQVEKLTIKNKEDIQLVFEQLKRFLIPPEQANRRRIGYRRYKDDE